MIEPALDLEKQADIKLTATRAGDEVKIDARATATSGDAKDEAKPKLRLVLIEESVRYPGGNKLRFHHNVVRAFPGGVDGKPLEGGEGVGRDHGQSLRASQEPGSLPRAIPHTVPAAAAFPNPLPPIDLDDLAVVALVQDDADHSIWLAEPDDRGPGSRRAAGCPAWRHTFPVEPGVLNNRAAVRPSVLVHLDEPSRPSPTVGRARGGHQDSPGDGRPIGRPHDRPSWRLFLALDLDPTCWVLL